MRHERKRTDEQEKRHCHADALFTAVPGGDRGHRCGRDHHFTEGTSHPADHQLYLGGSGLDPVLRPEGSEAPGGPCADSVWKVCRNLEGRRLLLCESILCQRQSCGQDKAEPERGRRQRREKIICDFHGWRQCTGRNAGEQ